MVIRKKLFDKLKIVAEIVYVSKPENSGVKFYLKDDEDKKINLDIEELKLLMEIEKLPNVI